MPEFSLSENASGPLPTRLSDGFNAKLYPLNYAKTVEFHPRRDRLQRTVPATRIFSALAVARLCVTIGRYWYLFKRLTAVSAGRFYRFEHKCHIVLAKHIQSRKAIPLHMREFISLLDV